ncbi:hypothetical protein LOC68_17200 [Blastopirellula sp. JC732]|uniref:Uncharacterized protein n=1 Tax=Blastopirellula sediminis TaxID=2894196 RepID=A0A9X1SH61_9BACT|nr:hypothetical protein [Blastopirellula sediminis]MCC9606569.1 hypothetical protein [Blastopirellula sediminis]MCC9630133.1 hypothetical protein [Blastopirellula sediminis]
MTTDRSSGEILNLRNYVCIGLLAYGAYRAFEGFQATDGPMRQQAFGVAGIMVVTSAILFAVWTRRGSRKQESAPEEPTADAADKTSEGEEK